MSKYNCLIIDDEPIAIEIIETYLDDLKDFRVVGTGNNAIQALEFLKNNSVDLLFLDIEMPRINGLQMLSVLKYKPEVILTTAYRNYAVESYEHEVLDYLLKPISFERFLKGIDKFYRSKSSLQTRSEEPVEIKVDKKHLLLKPTELLYFEGASDYVKVHTVQKTYITYERLSNFETLLKTRSFLRIHRSYIVNLAKIEKYSSQEVVLGEMCLPVGRRYKENLLKCMKKVRI